MDWHEISGCCKDVFEYRSSLFECYTLSNNLYNFIIRTGNDCLFVIKGQVKEMKIKVKKTIITYNDGSCRYIENEQIESIKIEIPKKKCGMIFG